ncbi:metal ABC transporter permease [Candidatus Roizmanbacteria bacterium]|nr:metal ABC transporter permease [Candidatus Roizmanbacteria bacterium]
MLEIFQYDFIARALIVGVVISVIAPLIGTFLVVKRYSLIADTLSHVSLLGVAIGMFMGFSPFIGALLMAVLSGVGMEELRERKNLLGDSVLALFLSGSLAIAVVLVSLAKGLNVNFVSYLFGSINTVSQGDIYTVIILGLVTFLFMTVFYRQFFLIALSEDLARAAGLPVRLINILLVIMAAITVSLAMRIVGVLLISALMIIPVISGLQWEKNFKQTIFIAVLFSLVSVITGIVFSYYFSLASGGTIVIVNLVIFIFSYLYNRD